MSEAAVMMMMTSEGHAHREGERDVQGGHDQEAATNSEEAGHSADQQAGRQDAGGPQGGAAGS